LEDDQGCAFADKDLKQIRGMIVDAETDERDDHSDAIMMMREALSACEEHIRRAREKEEEKEIGRMTHSLGPVITRNADYSFLA
jgi:hypothetical protein